MSLRVVYRGGARYDMGCRHHTVVSDQLVEDGGQDAGMSPVELFIGSLGSCVAYFVGRYCDRHQINCKGSRSRPTGPWPSSPIGSGPLSCASSCRKA